MANRKRLIFSTLLFFIFLARGEAKVTINSINMGYNRLIVNFDRDIPDRYIKYFVIKDRDSIRYVFDFKNTKILNRHLIDNIKYKAPVSSIRIAQYRPNTARLVIETSEPYAISYYRIDGDTYSIVLPRGIHSIKGLFASLNLDKKKSSSVSKSSSKTDKKQSVVSQSHLLKGSIPHLKKRYTVIIDPGHGGHDSGALDPTHRYYEKRAVLAIAKKVAYHLKEMGFRVIMTRSSDRFIKLHRRTRFANLKHGDIFVSIHANAVGKYGNANKAHGVETYYLSPARSARAKRVAAKENSIEFDKSYKKSMNLYIQTLTHSKIILSNKLAIDVQSNILKSLRSRYKAVSDGGVRPAPFWVLVGADMPAVLVETGYITNPWEKKRLYSPKYEDLLAKGIAKGIARFLANRERELE